MQSWVTLWSLIRKVDPLKFKISVMFICLWWGALLKMKNKTALIPHARSSLSWKWNYKVMDFYLCSSHQSPMQSRFSWMWLFWNSSLVLLYIAILNFKTVSSKLWWNEEINHRATTSAITIWMKIQIWLFWKSTSSLSISSSENSICATNYHDCSL